MDTELREKIERHGRWLRLDSKGERLDLTGANLCGVDFSGADLSEAIFKRANIRRSKFSAANLSGADFFEANLNYVDFTGSNLSGASLSGAFLEGALFSGAVIRQTNLSRTNLRHARDIVRVGPSIDGFEFFGVVREGTVWIKAGCRWFTAAEAREHWRRNRGGTKLGEERLELVDFIERTMLRRVES